VRSTRCSRRPRRRFRRWKGSGPTGRRLESFSREEASTALASLGAKVSDNVSKKTTGVFVGDSPGSKAAKAEKAGVPILSEDDLKKLVQDAPKTAPAGAVAQPRRRR
jgi:BRCT domain type II-containing protein